LRKTWQRENTKSIEFKDDLPLTVVEKLFKRALREEEIKKMKEKGDI